MISIKPNRAKAAFQELDAVGVLNNSRVRVTLMTDGKEKLHDYQVTHIVIGINAALPGQAVTVLLHLCRIDGYCIRNLMSSRVNVFGQTVVNVQGMNPNGHTNVIRHRGVACGEYLQ